MVIFCAFTPVALSLGNAPNTFGGVSSYHPPSGFPMRAQETSISRTDRIMRFKYLFFIIFKVFQNLGL